VKVEAKVENKAKDEVSTQLRMKHYVNTLHRVKNEMSNKAR
jgi:hypothetical protein